jgi:hypothetical protein
MAVDLAIIGVATYGGDGQSIEGDCKGQIFAGGPAKAAVWVYLITRRRIRR